MEKMLPCDWLAGKSVGIVLIMWEGPAHSWWCHPWSGSPGWYKEMGRTNHSGQASEQYSSTAFASVPALTSLPKLLWVTVYITAADT